MISDSISALPCLLCSTFTLCYSIPCIDWKRRMMVRPTGHFCLLFTFCIFNTFFQHPFFQHFLFSGLA